MHYIMLYLQCAEFNKKTCVCEWRNLELLLQFDRVGCCSDALDLRLGGALFKSRPGHRLYIVFSCFYSIPLNKSRDITLTTLQSFFFHILYNCSYISHTGLRRFVFQATENSIK